MVNINICWQQGLGAFSKALSTEISLKWYCESGGIAHWSGEKPLIVAPLCGAVKIWCQDLGGKKKAGRRLGACKMHLCSVWDLCFKRLVFWCFYTHEALPLILYIFCYCVIVDVLSLTCSWLLSFCSKKDGIIYIFINIKVWEFDKSKCLCWNIRKDDRKVMLSIKAFHQFPPSKRTHQRSRTEHLSESFED